MPCILLGTWFKLGGLHLEFKTGGSGMVDLARVGVDPLMSEP